MNNLVNIKLVRGDTFKFTFTCNYLDGVPLPFNEAEDEIYFTFKRSAKDYCYIFQKTFSKGEISYNNNIYEIKLKSADTANLDYITYFYDVCFKLKSSEETITVLRGNFSLEEEATWERNEGE